MSAQHCVEYLHRATRDSNSDSTLTYPSLSIVINPSPDRQLPPVDGCPLAGISEVRDYWGHCVPFCFFKEEAITPISLLVVRPKIPYLWHNPNSDNFWEVDFGLTPATLLSGRSPLTSLPEVDFAKASCSPSPPCPQPGGVSPSEISDIPHHPPVLNQEGVTVRDISGILVPFLSGAG
jgi:hypothetical protein